MNSKIDSIFIPEIQNSFNSVTLFTVKKSELILKITYETYTEPAFFCLMV